MYESVSAATVLAVCGLSRPTSLTTNISVQRLDLLLIHLRHNLTFQFHRRPYNTHNMRPYALRPTQPSIPSGLVNEY